MTRSQTSNVLLALSVMTERLRALSSITTDEYFTETPERNLANLKYHIEQASILVCFMDSLADDIDIELNKIRGKVDEEVNPYLLKIDSMLEDIKGDENTLEQIYLFASKLCGREER